MDIELKKYRAYKRDLRFMLVCSGLWPDYKKHSIALRYFLSLCSALACGIVSFFILSFCVKFFINISLLTRGLGLFISFSSAFLKVCILSLHRKDLSSLNSGLSARFAQDLRKPENRLHLLAHLRTFTRFFYTFDYSVAMNVMLYALIPLSFLRKGKYVRMYPQVLPFAYDSGGPIHWSYYGFEVVTGFFLWSVTCGVDSFFGYFSLHMVGELRLLSHKFKRLKSTDCYKKDLKDCVERHVDLIKYKRILERVFGFLAIWLAVTCAVVLCALIFQAAQTKQFTVLKICYLICYSFLKLVQAYSYAWFGNIIAIESQACLDSMYESLWPGCGNVRFMNDVLIVLSQKPFAFVAKSVMLLEMNMFQKIVNTSVSYFFLLQALAETLD